MTQPTILLTGATDGVGRLVASDIARLFPKATILIHGRDSQKVNLTSEELKAQTPDIKIESFVCDFSSLGEVRLMANAIVEKYKSINILINNAATGFVAPPDTNKYGIESRMVVNYLAPYLLTRTILPALKNGAPSRIVNVSSTGQGNLYFDKDSFEAPVDGVTAYRQSKLALIMFTFDLAEELKHDNVTVNTLHPGSYLDTNMIAEAGVEPLGTAQSGADAEMYLATSPELDGITGQYFNVNTESNALDQAYDLDVRKKLREITERLLADK